MAGKWIQRGKWQCTVASIPWGHSGAPHCQWGLGKPRRVRIGSGFSIAATSTLLTIFIQGSMPVCHIPTVPEASFLTNQKTLLAHSKAQYVCPASVSLPVRRNDNSNSTVFMGSSNMCVPLKGPGVQLMLFLFYHLATSH